MFKIDHVIKFQGCGKNKEALVKRKGWPEKFNLWIPASNIVLTTSGDTTTHLPLPIEVEGYGFGIIELIGKVQNGFGHPLYLCCDICEESTVGNIKIPVLRYLNRNFRNGIINKPIDHVI